MTAYVSSRAVRRAIALAAFFLVLAVSLPQAVSADSRVRVQATMEPAYPVAGQEIRLTVRATDNLHRHLSRAQVVVTAWMDHRQNPDMAPMPETGATRATPMRFAAVPQVSAGEYLVTGALPMSGRWKMQVWVNSPGATGMTDLEVDVVSQPPAEGMNWPALAGFLTMIAGAAAGGRLLRGRGASGEPLNLLRSSRLLAFLRSRWYPALFQVPVATVFVFILYLLFGGPGSAHDNFGSSLVWVVWWPVLPLIFLIFGRFWCAICPVSALSDLVQRALGQHRPAPLFLKRWGVWLIFAAFLAITWLDAVSGLVASPLRTAALLLAMIGGVIYCAALYERRSWCRYLCFIGGMSSNYAMTSILELRADREICRGCHTFECTQGNERAGGCPMFVFPRNMDSNRHCNLCGNCIKSCRKDALRLSVRVPGEEMSKLRRRKWDEALFATLLLGIVGVQTVVMTETWTNVEAYLNGIGVSTYPLAVTLAMMGALALPVAALAGAAAVSGRISRSGFSADMTRYAYAFIPLGLAVHLAHNLNHLLGEALSALKSGLLLAGRSLPLHPSLLSAGTIQTLQLVLVAVGALLAVSVILRFTRQDGELKQESPLISRLASLRRHLPALPHVALVLGASLAFAWIFSQPMVPRMQMSAEAHEDITPGEIDRARSSVRDFTGRNLSLSYIHLEQHGYRDIILKSGQDYYFVDAENYSVVSMFSEKPLPAMGARIKAEDAERIAHSFALRHYPDFYDKQLEPDRGSQESSPFVEGYVFKWRQYLDGVPTPNAVKVILDRQGRVAIYSSRRAPVTAPTAPAFGRDRALEIARSFAGYTPNRQSASLDIGPELTGRQILRWTVLLERQPDAGSTVHGPRHSEIVIDAITSEVTSIVEWS